MAWVIARDTSFRNYSKRIYWLKPRVDVFGSGSGSGSGVATGAGLENLDTALNLNILYVEDYSVIFNDPERINPIAVSGGQPEAIIGEYTYQTNGRLGRGWYKVSPVYGPEYYAIAFTGNRFYLYVGEHQVMRTRSTFDSFDLSNVFTFWEQATYTQYFGPGAIVGFEFA